MTTNVMYEISPYGFTHVHGEGWWMWSIVVDALQKYEATAELQNALPREIQRPGALVGLSVGLAFRQLAITAEQWRFARIPWVPLSSVPSPH